MTVLLSGAPLLPDAVLRSLVGRDVELAELRRLLSESTGLVTVTGSSGIGKTRLVQALMADQDPVWLNAAGLDDPRMLLPAIEEHAKAMLTDPHGVTRVIVLDSLDDDSIGPALGALLSRFPWLRLLVTSQTRMNVTSEVLFRLQPLRYPKTRNTLDVEQPEQWAAITCFVQAARRVAPSFDINDDNADHVIELVALSGGFPLAIELAAQWLRVCDLTEMVRRARVSLELYSGGTSDLPTRHQDLRTSIREAVDAFPTEEHEVLEVLAHLGDVSLAGLRNGLGHDVPLDVLGRLIDRNVIHSHPGPPHTLGLHPLMRQVIAARTNGTTIQQRFLQWLHEHVNLAAPDVYTIRSKQAFATLDALTPDINAALDLLTTHPETVAELIITTHEYRICTSGHQIQAYWTQRALDALPTTTTTLTGRLHSRAARALHVFDLEAARHHADQARAIAEQHDDPLTLAQAIHFQLNIRFLSGEAPGDDEFDLALQICTAHHLTAERADLLFTRALLCQYQRRDFDAARRDASASIDTAREIGDLATTGFSMALLGNIYTRSGDVTIALTICDEALQLAEQLDRRVGIVEHALLARGLFYTEIGRLDDAADADRRAVAILESSTAAGELAQALRDLGYNLAAVGHVEEATQHFLRSIRLYDTLGQQFLTMVTLTTLAVTPSPVRPPLPLCDQTLRLLNEMSPGFADSQLGFWRERIQELHDELSAHPTNTNAPELSLSYAELVTAVCTHLRQPATPTPPMGLTRREHEVLELLADGLTDREIAQRLFVSTRTVNTHVAGVLRKLGVDRRRDAARWLRQQPARSG